MLRSTLQTFPKSVIRQGCYVFWTPAPREISSCLKNPSLPCTKPLLFRPKLTSGLIRSYKDMHHKHETWRGFSNSETPWSSKFLIGVVIFAFTYACVNWRAIPEYIPWFPDFSQQHYARITEEDWENNNYLYPGSVPKAFAPRKGIKTVDAAELKSSGDLESDERPTEIVDKNKEGFRDRKIIEYENRIRAYSTPDKVFRLFATLKIHDPKGDGYGIYMTPDDFVRAITPGIRQPEGLGLDHFRTFDPSKDKLHTDIPNDSIFHQIGSNGLISFSDYLFLMTLLSISARHIEIAFKIFDINGDGNVDADEFEEILNVLRQQTSVGMRHREAKMTGSSYQGSPFVASGLKNYFFGMDGKGKLKVQDFLAFQTKMKDEVLRIEFERMAPDQNGKITERQFGKMLLSYAGISDQKQKRMLKRIKERFSGKSAKGIDFQQVESFSQVFRHLNDVDTALGLYHAMGGSIDQATLKRVVKTIAKSDLDDHVVDVVFALFDDNDDGRLSQREFISIMKARQMRGLERPKDMGYFSNHILQNFWYCPASRVSRLLGAVWRCTKDEVHGVHH